MEDYVLHVYGKVSIPSVFCKSCQQESFVIGGKKNCCGQRVVVSSRPSRTVYEVDCANMRRRPLSESRKRRILEWQKNRCFYCGIEFGTMRRFRDEWEWVDAEFDHVLPFAFNQDDTRSVFVASCRRCNQHKTSKVFETVQEIMRYMQDYYEKNRTRNYV